MLGASFTADDLSAREVLERFKKIFGREMSGSRATRFISLSSGECLAGQVHSADRVS